MNKKIPFPIAIIIIIVCAVLVGGLVVWQYFGIPKGEEEISEAEPSEEEAPIAVRYTAVILEEGPNRGPYSPIRRLIGIQDDGTKVVILENVNEVLPISKYGQKIGRDKKKDDLYVIPFIYSFAPEEQKVYIKRVEDGTEIHDYVYEYDLLSSNVRQLNLPAKYIYSYNHYHKVSPDGTKVVVYGYDGVGVFDLIKNEEVIFIKEEDIDGILGHEAAVSLPENAALNLLQWKSSTVVEYPVYQETEEKYIYKLKTIETINLAEAKDETADLFPKDLATEDWKTYKNEQYGYEIKYPSDWIIIKEDEKFIVFADEKEAEIQREKQAGEIRCAAGAYFYNNEEALSLYDWAIDKWGEPKNRERGKITKVEINDLERIKYEFMSMGIQTNVLFSKDNKVINIQTTFNSCDNLDIIFNQMLSTFRFLE